MEGYWSTVLTQRVNRRRLMTATGTFAAGAAFLAACGGNSSGKGDVDRSGLLTKPVDTTKRAVKGGIWPQVVTSDAASLDSMTGIGRRPLDEAAHVYSRLVRYKIGTFDKPAKGDIEGDAAVSWELSPDQTQLTLKLRPNMKFDPRPPTSGRFLHSGDVKFSWERFSRISPNRSEAVNAINPDAPIESVLTPDASTVVIKTAEPYAPLLKMLAFFWWMAVYPMEAEGGYDPRREMRGSGPWMLTNYQPSVVYEYRKNPNYYDIESRPFLDGKDRHIIPEYASAIAALAAGRIWNYSEGSSTGQSLIRAEDVVPLKRQNPQLMMLTNDNLETSRNQFVLVFSGRETSPLRDERVRRAASMLLDRDAFIDTFYNVSDHARNGLTVETRWESHISPGFGFFWLDPQGDKLGEGAKYFRHNPSEAKKLLDAAGRFGLETDYSYHASGGFSGRGGSIARNMEVLRDMLAGEGHFNLRVNVVDYSVFSQRYQNTKADFDGIASLPSSTFPDIDPWLSSVYTVNGRASFVKNPLPRVQDLILQQRRVSDEQKRTAIIHDLQRELALQMPDVPFPGIAQGFDLAWPMLGNYGHFQSYVPLQGGAQEFDTLVWYDKSKDTRNT